MGHLKKPLAILICLVVALSLLAGTAFAKGSVGGGRSSFSSGSKGVTSGKSYSTSQSNYSSKPATGSGTQSPAPAGSGTASSGTSASSAPSSGTSYGSGYSTGTNDISTPRQGNPPTMYQDYQTGKSGYSTGQGSYSTNRQSYNGAWDRSVSPESDRFPQKQPVGIFGSPPQNPYYYNNSYWGMPWWSRMFFQPNYYYTPWGYHYFAPRLFTWLLTLGLLGGGGYFLYRFLARRRM